MKYFLNDGEKLLKLKFIKVDSDSNTILEIIPDDEVVIDAEEYVSHLNEEMTCSAQEIGQCVERMQSYYREKYKGLTVIYEYASDDTIRKCLLNDYDENRKDNGNIELSIEQIRSMF